MDNTQMSFFNLPKAEKNLDETRKNKQFRKLNSFEKEKIVFW
jgi:hypothetical protein